VTTPAPPAARRRGFSLTSPGPKEYLIVGGAALGLFLLYDWWKNRTAAATSSTGSTGSGSAPSTPTGLSTSALTAFFQDFQSSTRPSGSTKVKVPNVVGQRREEAGPVIRRAGLVADFSAREGVVTREEPKAGSSVEKGSSVSLTLKGK
jgi:hypothetical protein